MHTLYTAGYQGRNISEFHAAVRRAGISAVVDIRANPVSRKPGFSKRHLTHDLPSAYIHLGELGTPAPARQAWKDGDMEGFRRMYREYLASDEGRMAMEMLFVVASGYTACLLCFEADPATCHRQMVKDELLRLSPGMFKAHELDYAEFGLDPIEEGGA